MSHRYSSSTNASRVAEGVSSRGALVPKTPITERTFSDNQSQRTFFGAFSAHTGRTSKFAKRLSSRISEPSTFYREATPPGSSQGEPEVPPTRETYDPRYDYVAPPAPLPVATVCGIPRRKFCILLWVLVLAIVIAIAVPVGVVFGLRSSHHKSAGDGSSGATSTSTQMTSATPSPTTTSTAPSAASTSVIPCPAANNTRYLVPDTEKIFKRFCGIDYSGVDQARDLGSVWTNTMQECMFQCADFPGCTACGWGVIPDDPGSEHRCWLKADLKSSHSARSGWDFAILEQ